MNLPFKNALWFSREIRDQGVGHARNTRKHIHRARNHVGDSIDRAQLCRRWSSLRTLQIVVLATDKTVNSPRNGRSSFSRSRGRKKKKNLLAVYRKVCVRAQTFVQTKGPNPCIYLRALLTGKKRNPEAMWDEAYTIFQYSWLPSNSLFSGALEHGAMWQ